MEALQDRYRADMNAWREESGRIYTLTIWALGILVTGFLAVVALGFSAISAIRKGGNTATRAD
jgi:hypothetical protein